MASILWFIWSVRMFGRLGQSEPSESDSPEYVGPRVQLPTYDYMHSPRLKYVCVSAKNVQTGTYTDLHPLDSQGGGAGTLWALVALQAPEA